MYLSKTPEFVKPIANNLLWNFPTKQKEVFLTFDDGPIPEVTPWVLQQLSEFGAKATFFMVGDNVQKHSSIKDQVISAGHSIGNHTQHHLKGWKTSTYSYVKDSLIAAKQIESPLFRPPYGKLTRTQSKALRARYTIVMWDVLSADFDQSLSSNQVVDNVMNNVQPGSIVVMHDSLKAERHLRYTLPIILKKLSEQGYRFSSIPMHHWHPRIEEAPITSLTELPA
jgi:peptidoglycan/xylan/chitin deacetylase (PgdA/CDA1 family)